MTLSTAAATGRSDDVVSSWKLDNSRTNTSGQGRAPPAVSKGANTSSTASPMLPATTVARPAARHSAPVSAVTVVLPFVPVIASTFCVRRQRAREEFDVADELRAACHCRRDRRLVLGHARADRDQVRAGQRRIGERAGGQRHVRQRRSELGRTRRLRAGIGDAHARAFAREIPRQRQPGHPESQHDGIAVLVFHLQRSFSVERPNSTSSIVTIQKRTTTWFSFHPFNSK